MKAKFADKRPARKVSKEDKAEAERTQRRKEVIKYASESLARKVGESGYPATSLLGTNPSFKEAEEEVSYQELQQSFHEDNQP